jgi:hypothetical protein
MVISGSFAAKSWRMLNECLIPSGGDGDPFVQAQEHIQNKE